MLDARKEEAFCTILREELQLATGCTEPIAVAYCAARLRQVLGERPRRILAEVSGNILKNVKSVVVPNTGGRRGLPAAIAVGVVAGDPEARLQVIAHVTEEDTAAIQAYLDSTDIRIDCPPTSRMLDIRLTGWAGDHKAVVHVANNLRGAGRGGPAGKAPLRLCRGQFAGQERAERPGYPDVCRDSGRVPH